MRQTGFTLVELTEKQLAEAYKTWLFQHPFKDADNDLEPFLSEKIISQTEWIKKARQGLMLSSVTLAGKMGITRQGYCELEKGETKGTLTLQKMKEAAEAMDCEFVYAIRPKQRRPFSELIWEKLLEASLNHPWVTSRPQTLKVRALVAIARLTIRKVKFREENGLNRRFNGTSIAKE